MRPLISIIVFIGLLTYTACSVTDNQNCDAAHLAQYTQQGAKGKIDACFKNGAPIDITFEGKTLLQIARENNNLTLGQHLTSLQWQAYKKNDMPLDTTTLLNAIAYDNTNIVQHYIDKGFDLHPFYRDGLSPVVYAIFNDSNNVLKQLLNYGIDVGYEFDSRPLICMAAMFNQMETMKILLKQGANVNDLDGSGVSPLMFAARDGNVEMAKFLLTKGADKSLREIRYQTAADMVKNNEELKALLQVE